MLENGTVLTGKQLEELHSASNLVNTLEMAMKHMFHEGSDRIEEDLVGLLELVGVVFKKLNFVGCTDDLEAELSRRPSVNRPETLAELIIQLLKMHQASGNMRVFTGDMIPVELEVVTAPEEPEKHGLRFLHVGP